MTNVILACSVCFGDPNSALSKGTAMGVLFLMGVVFVVLAAIASTLLVWANRARKRSWGLTPQVGGQP